MSKKPEYLGDSVYALDDGYHVVLSANDGDETIYLEERVVDAFLRFLEKSRGVEITVKKKNEASP